MGGAPSRSALERDDEHCTGPVGGFTPLLASQIDAVRLTDRHPQHEYCQWMACGCTTGRGDVQSVAALSGGLVMRLRVLIVAGLTL